MDAKMSASIRVGTCNWSDHAGFYPPGVKPADRLAYYARHFPIVEVDSTFYHPPSARAAARWAETTPDDFIFNVKAYRALTLHERGANGDILIPGDEAAAQFRAALTPLRDAGKLRAILFQFPPWFVANDRCRDHLCWVRDRFADDLLAIEFRHRSWLAPQEEGRTLATLRDLGLVYCIVDEPQGATNSVPPIVAVTHPDLAIVRFHGRNQATWNDPTLKGTTERYNYRYTEEELRDWLPAIGEIAQEARAVHLLFNNNAGNHAVGNARDLRALLGQPNAPLTETVTQPSLF